jgi:hypothetical protein
MAKSIGNKCTWKAASPFTKDFSLQVNALAQNAMCPALTTTGMMMDGPLTTFFQSRFATGATPVCAPAANGAAALVPTMALMALFAFAA